jgi:hypothetical protein
VDFERCLFRRRLGFEFRLIKSCDYFLSRGRMFSKHERHSRLVGNEIDLRHGRAALRSRCLLQDSCPHLRFGFKRGESLFLDCGDHRFLIFRLQSRDAEQMSGRYFAAGILTGFVLHVGRKFEQTQESRDFRFRLAGFFGELLLRISIGIAQLRKGIRNFKRMELRPMPVLGDLMYEDFIALGIFDPAGEFFETRGLRGAVAAFARDNLVNVIGFDVTDGDRLQEALLPEGSCELIERRRVEFASRLRGIRTNPVDSDGKGASEVPAPFVRSRAQRGVMPQRQLRWRLKCLVGGRLRASASTG